MRRWVARKDLACWDYLVSRSRVNALHYYYYYSSVLYPYIIIIIITQVYYIVRKRKGH